MSAAFKDSFPLAGVSIVSAIQKEAGLRFSIMLGYVRSVEKRDARFGQFAGMNSRGIAQNGS
jgi:hypothetical protein